ncbi:MAG TPA: DMT family transporter [Rectinemataceae bacterium]|nr:DMT family transporter [Rectinemataceae bacterium]
MSGPVGAADGISQAPAAAISPAPGSARARGVLLALLSASAFSMLGLFAKLIYSGGLSVPQALAWRFTVASLVLWSIVGITKRPPAGRGLVPVILLGTFGFAPQAGLYFLTVSIINPGITSLLLYLYPSFVILLSIVFLARKPNSIQLLSLALSLVGCAITFFKPGNYPLIGLVLGAVMALVYGAYLVVGERVLDKVDPIRATALIMSSAAVVYWSMSIVTRGVQLPSTAHAIEGILGAAVISSVLAVTALFGAIKLIGAADTSLLSTLEPVLTVILSGLFLGERLGGAQAVGGVLILAAVVVLRFEPRPGVKLP